jgi:hypothetical protein
MAQIFMLPNLFRPKREPGDDVSKAFATCCNALNPLSPKARDMVSGWVADRYAAQLEEDLQPVPEALIANEWERQ